MGKEQRSVQENKGEIWKKDLESKKELGGNKEHGGDKKRGDNKE